MRDEILKMIVALKAIKISVSKIESDLGFSNGLIGKASKGNTTLSEEKFKKLQEYFAEKTKIESPVTPKTKLVVDEVGIKEKPSDETLTRIRALNEKINKDFGAGTVMLFGDKPEKGYKVISTGSLLLDIALGIGGLPRGRMVEIFGLESSGKTTIALQVMANAQKQGLKCLLIDAENAFDPEYADALGIKVDELDYCQPSYGEQGFEVADRKIMTGDYGVVVIDSVAAMIPKAELEGEMGDSKLGLHARLMSQVCRKLVNSVANTNTLVIFINQIRNKIGVTYGSPEVTTGGMALQFYASVRLEVRRSTTNENSVINNGVKEGNQVTVKVVKNKCAPPFRKAVFDILYGKGVDTLGEIVDAGIGWGIIKKSGSWFSYNGSQVGQGRDAVREFLNDNLEVAKEIEKKIRTEDCKN